MKSIYKNSFIALIVLVSVVFIAADFPAWIVPQTANDVTNPMPKDKVALEEGSSMYKMQCAACHGPKGKGDGAIASADLTSPEFLGQSDGAILHKLKEGRGQMPSFKALDENSLWKLIHFIRDISAAKEDVPKRNAKIYLSLYDSEGGVNKVIAKVLELLPDGKTIPASEIKMGVYVQRYFGLLPIGETRCYTNIDGQVIVDFPSNIPGDENGKLKIVARVEDSEFNPIEISSSAKWGTSQAASNWENERALWKNNKYIPYWVIFSYLGITLGIGIGVLYVLLLIRKIKKVGDVVA